MAERAYDGTGRPVSSHMRRDKSVRMSSRCSAVVTADRSSPCGSSPSLAIRTGADRRAARRSGSVMVPESSHAKSAVTRPGGGGAGGAAPGTTVLYLAARAPRPQSASPTGTHSNMVHRTSLMPSKLGILLATGLLGCTPSRRPPPRSVRQPGHPGLVRRPGGASSSAAGTGSIPTYSAPYDEQTFMDASRRRTWSTWTKHPRIIDTDDRQVGPAGDVGAVDRREGRQVLPVLRRQRHPERPAARRHRRRRRRPARRGRSRTTSASRWSTSSTTAPSRSTSSCSRTRTASTT